MEPRSIKRGNMQPGGSVIRAVDVASMEPRSIKRGNASSSTAATLRDPRFNGAALDQARKSSHFAPRFDRSAIAASMEPRSIKRGNDHRSARAIARAAELQWSRARSSAEIEQERNTIGLTLIGFNGAALDQARKSRRQRHGSGDDGYASMEPRSIKRGNRGGPWSAIALAGWLQWSRARSSAEIAIAVARSTLHASRLQWSRARSSAEMMPSCARRSCRRRASMEPRSIKRGNDGAGSAMAPAPESCFNGAALDQARKCSPASMRVSRASGFNGAALDQARKSPSGCSTTDTSMAALQWSRARSSAEMTSTQAGAGSTVSASMEPRSIKRGNTRRDADRAARSSASMEPRSIKRGNAHGAGRAISPRVLLQWSRARSSAEIVSDAAA